MAVTFEMLLECNNHELTVPASFLLFNNNYCTMLVLTWCCKSSIAKLASMGFCTGMSIHMVLKRGQSLEASFAYAALVGTFFRVWLHVTRQQISLWTGVVTIIAHMRLSYNLRFPVEYLNNLRLVIFSIRVDHATAFFIVIKIVHCNITTSGY